MAKKNQFSRNKRKQDKPSVKPPDDSPDGPAATEHISLINFDRYQALFLALLIFLGFTIYSNTLNSPFVFDDSNSIQNNVFIRMEEISGKNIIQAATGWGKNRPVSMLSFAFNYYFGRYDTWGYHLVNNFIHIINGILLFFLVQLTLALANSQNTAERKFDPMTVTTLSFFTALLWLVNPVQTQSVTYIVQ